MECPTVCVASISNTPNNIMLLQSASSSSILRIGVSPSPVGFLATPPRSYSAREAYRVGPLTHAEYEALALPTPRNSTVPAKYVLFKMMQCAHFDDIDMSAEILWYKPPPLRILRRCFMSSNGTYTTVEPWMVSISSELRSTMRLVDDI